MNKALFKLNGVLIRLRNRVLKPFSVGVRAIVVNDQGQVLLVRHSYGRAWYLPGGGVDKKEHLPDALARELIEELNLKITGGISLLGTYGNFFEHKSDYTSVFIVKSFELSPVLNNEIETWQFFDTGKLPEGVSPGTKRRIQEYLGQRPLDFRW